MKYLLSILVMCFALPAFAQEAASPENLPLVAPAEAPAEPAVYEEFVDPEASHDPEASPDAESASDAIPSAESAPALAEPIELKPAAANPAMPTDAAPAAAEPAPVDVPAETPAVEKTPEPAAPATEEKPAEQAAPSPAQEGEAAPAAPGEEVFMYDVAVLQGLNKVTARISEIEAPVGTSVRFGNLDIVVKKCWKSPPTEQPENAARVEILERRPNETPVEVFNGWMFSSSPSLSGLEHPVYDLVVLSCGKRKMTPNT